MASLSTPGTISAEDRAAVENFRRDVLEASLDNLVLVRFTATWCGPCKQLAPIIDKVIAEHGRGRTKQVVIDIDQQRLLAEQFRIQSVPTVYAFLGGNPVDGFVGMKSESEIKMFLERLLEALPPTQEQQSVEAHMETANALLAEGDAAGAAATFGALLEQHPDRADLVGGYARALLALGNLEGAKEALGTLPADCKDAAVLQARTALDLAASAAPPAEILALQQRIAANPGDHQARIDLAQTLFASGQPDEAAEHLFASIAADRAWNEGAARTQLLKLIEAKGLSDPWSIAARRRLSQLLFS